jgi:hypothetical protein
MHRKQILKRGRESLKIFNMPVCNSTLQYNYLWFQSIEEFYLYMKMMGCITLFVCLLINGVSSSVSASIISVFKTASSILRLKHSSAASKKERYNKFEVIYVDQSAFLYWRTST